MDNRCNSTVLLTTPKNVLHGWRAAARAEAMKAGQYLAAVSAIREKGVLSGKRVERSERGVPEEYADLENMTVDELRAVLVERLAAAGLRLVAIDAGIGAGSPGSQPN